MKTICSAIACALVALCAAPAAAQSAHGTRNATSIRYVDVRADSVSGGSAAVANRSATVQVFELLDRNRDGKLDETELGAEAAQRYDWIALDSDGDGAITLREFTVLRPRALAYGR
jgi:hypothetical protein